jgi:hypothetical protein
MLMMLWNGCGYRQERSSSSSSAWTNVVCESSRSRCCYWRAKELKRCHFRSGVDVGKGTNTRQNEHPVWKGGMAMEVIAVVASVRA